MPELPTVAESGVAGFEATNWFGVLAPRGTPQAIIQQIHALMASSARSNDVKERLLRDGADAVGGTPQEFAQLIKTELKRWGEVVKLSGARVD
jgi:tripartite-type tricarboxylate transporter receptor subunit TctC